MANSLKYQQKSFSVGDTIRVHQRIKEGDKERVQVFEGVLIAVKGKEANKSFTVRKIASGSIGVEKIWPVLLPSIEKIELKKRGKARRAKLYYLRGRTGKLATKVKEIKAKSKSPAPNDKPKAKRKTRRTASQKSTSK